MWVDKESHLLRKRTERDRAHLVTTIYEPVINAPIEPAQLSRPMVEPALTSEERIQRSAEKAKAIIGTQARSFVAERVSGSYPVALDKLRGHVVVLEFFGTWCPPCGPAADELKKVDQSHAKEGVRTIALSAETTTSISQFGREHGVGFTLGRDNLGEIQRAYGLEPIPSVVIIDGSGIVRDVQIGFATGEIEAAITKTLRDGEKAAP
jgi:peroxiredoxin